MRNSAIIRVLLVVLAVVSTFAVVPSESRASEGGGGQCPWGSDLSLSVDGKKVVVPQALFSAKVKQSTINGFEVLVDTGGLKLVFVAANGDTWEAALTVIDGGKRCLAFFAGDPYPVGEAAVPVVALDPPGGRAAARP